MGGDRGSGGRRKMDARRKDMYTRTSIWCTMCRGEKESAPVESPWALEEKGCMGFDYDYDYDYDFVLNC